MNPVIAFRLFLAIIFTRAAWHKLGYTQRFQSELRAYKLLPDALISPTAYFLALLELVCSGMLVLSESAVLPLLFAAGLLSLYTLAMVINIKRGIINIDCGCSSWLSPRKKISWSLVIRNTIIIALAILAAIGTKTINTIEQPSSFSTSIFHIYGGIVLATITFLLLYEAAEQAITNTQRAVKR